MLNLHTASKLLFTVGKIGQISEVLSQLSSEELCSQHKAGLRVTVTPTLPDLCWTWNMMGHASLLQNSPCLRFSLGPKLPESNLLSRAFLKPAQITHP